MFMERNNTARNKLLGFGYLFRNRKLNEFFFLLNTSTLNKFIFTGLLVFCLVFY